MDQQEIKSLLEKYRSGTCSEQEKAILESWYNQQAAQRPLNLTEERLELNLKEVSNRLPLKYPARQKRLWPRIAAAASIVAILGASLMYYQVRQSGQQLNLTAEQDIAPGGNKAYLTLADGRKISLTEAANGQIAGQAGITITKTADGQLVYSVAGNARGAAAAGYNTIETPKGGQYRVQLPDGTEVWLNAQSSLRYPASFEALNERRVELSGEGYFEVAKDRAHPFIVKSGDQEVKVLGTHFNISNYADEPAVKTTLLEGSVQLNGKTVLKPGQQASIPASGEISISRVDMEEAIAWKNGKFIFADENIQSIMRKLSRWYNVEVHYEGAPPTETFTASIGRFDRISKILDKLSYTNNVHFKLEGRRVTVMK
ncbi:FecR family protein [Pedobacter faecalis]|uniref:FecR family protein n=1 Tax=Pedobacter faecalis TaxID=3041495 RepID=UPI00254CA9CD|nr:FecR family protein [Pedobacter sp. ELA7]